MNKNTITEEIINSKIKNTEYKIIGVKTTICCITLVNNFEIIGVSACVDPANFNVELGQELAYKNAFNKIWELEGYRLQSELKELAWEKEYQLPKEYLEADSNNPIKLD
jgi:hypothetical protein